MPAPMKTETLHPQIRHAMAAAPPTATRWRIVATAALMAIPLAADAIETRPLAPRAESGTPTLFERLPSGRTGVDPAPPTVPEAAHRRLDASANFFAEDAYGGVCVGDYDGDGRPDFFATSPYGGHRLYRNLGGFRFEETAERAGVAGPEFWARGACFADLDNDRDLDLFVCGNGEANRLYWNRGDGTFARAEAAWLDHPDANTMMAFADYDNDGDLDGYLVVNDPNERSFEEDFQLEVTFRDGKAVIPEADRETYDVLLHPELGPKVIKVGQNDHLYRNDGGGEFTDVTRAAGISGPGMGLAATWWDYNNDNRPDLYVANDFYTPDKLYRNNGDGTFTDVIAEAVPHTPWFSMGTDTGDIDNDGRLDFMATDMSGSTHYKSKLGMGDMEKSRWFLTLPTPRQYMRNALYLNTGTGRFMEVAQMAGVANTDWTWSAKFADLDNDGWIDLYFTNGMTRDLTHSDLVRQAGQLPSAEAKRAFWAKQGRKKDRNMAFRNLGDLRFEPAGEAWGLDTLGVSFGAAFADFDGDGDLDLVTTDLDTPLTLYRNNSHAHHLVKIQLRGGDGNTHGVGARVELEAGGTRQIRFLNLCQGYISSNEPLLHFGLGEATRVDRLTVHWPSGRVQTLRDLPADRLLVVTEPAEPTPAAPATEPAAAPMYRPSERLAHARHRENRFDDFAAQPLLPNRMSRLGPGVAWADVDGDGDTDFFHCGAKDQPSDLFLRQPGGFTPVSNQQFDFFAAQEDMSALFFEFNGDGAPDLYVAAGGAAYPAGSPYLHDRLYLNDGKGGFRMAREETPDIRDSGGPAAAADYDRDGDLDWFVGGRVVPGRYPTAPRSHLVRNDAGQATAIVTDEVAPGLATAGMVTAALWSDVDADGWTDLLVAHEWGPVRLWRNREGRLEDETAAAGLADLTGWWNSLAAGDFDRDGDIDFVAGNFGLNTKYHASPEHPVVAHYGDMDGSGTNRFVEAKYEGDTLFPVRGRSCSTRAIPGLVPRFPDFDTFARATLLEVYPKEQLRGTLRVEVNTLESGVFINDGAGRFAFRPLPRLAQAAPAFGLVALDADEDGAPDIYMAQNFFGPQAETGRMAGGVGLLLRGRGDGTFDPVPPHRSGLVVSGDAKAAAAVDLTGDGRPDLVVSQNNGPLRLFERVADGDPRTLRLVLQGPPGNPNAIGARVVVRFSDGTSQAAETRAGSGYLSQSSGPLIFALADRTAASIQVRWPDGTETTHDKPAAGPLTIRQPRTE